jgi:hypothetical protein
MTVQTAEKLIENDEFFVNKHIKQINFLQQNVSLFNHLCYISGIMNPEIVNNICIIKRTFFY